MLYLYITVLAIIVKDSSQAIYTVSGRTTRVGDDETAVATCNEGDVAISCDCPYKVGQALDGLIVSENACTCYLSGRFNSHITVTAVCSTKKQCPNLNPDSPPSEYTVVSSPGYQAGSVTLECPENYVLDSCYYHSWWVRTTYGAYGSGISPTIQGNVCTANYSPRKKLTAVCQMRESYWYSNNCDDPWVPDMDCPANRVYNSDPCDRTTGCLYFCSGNLCKKQCNCVENWVFMTICNIMGDSSDTVQCDTDADCRSVSSNDCSGPCAGPNGDSYHWVEWW